jgi:hypothetical protein
LKDATGPERKKAVIGMLSEAIDIPFVPEWGESIFEPVLYGFVIDAVVKWWNAVTGHAFENLVLTPEVTEKTFEAVKAEVKGTAAPKLPDTMPSVDPKTGEQLTVDQRFDALLAKYAVREG